MSARKYHDDVSVVWSVVLKSIECQITRERLRFEEFSSDVLHELSHKSVNSEKLAQSLRFSSGCCERVFQWYDTLCSLRSFLGMKFRSPMQLDIQQCYEFYGQYVGDNFANEDSRGVVESA